MVEKMNGTERDVTIGDYNAAAAAFIRDEEFRLVALALLNVFPQSRPSGFEVTEGRSIPRFPRQFAPR